MSRMSDAPKPGRPGMLGAEWLNGAAMEGMMRASEACNQAYQEWQRELMRFIAGRMQVDTQHIQQLVTCQNWADATRLHQDWAISAAQEFTKEANTLLQMVSKIGTELTTTTVGRPH